MHRFKHAKWVSTFDHEPFIAAILRRLTIFSAACLIGGLAWRWLTKGRFGFHGSIEGTNVASFLLSDIHRGFSGACIPRLLLHLGLATLFMIPYVRLLGSLWYFAWVERNARYALYTGCVVATLTYILFLG